MRDDVPGAGRGTPRPTSGARSAGPDATRDGEAGGSSGPAISIVVADPDLFRGHGLVRAFARLEPTVRCVHAPTTYAAHEAVGSVAAAVVVLDDALVPDGSLAVVRELVQAPVPPAVVVLADEVRPGDDGHPGATTVVSRHLPRGRIVEVVLAVALAELRRRERHRLAVAAAARTGEPDAFRRLAALVGTDPDEVEAVAAADEAGSNAPPVSGEADARRGEDGPPRRDAP